MKHMHSLFLIIGLVFFVSSCGDAVDHKEAAPPPKEVPQKREEALLSFAPVVKQVAPAVVNIYAAQEVKTKFADSPFMRDPFFRQFFEEFHGGEGYNKEQNALGSGIIVSKDGLVLTNYHVIEGADTIHVALSDKREFKAELVALDKRTDLALLKINGKKDFPFLSIEPQSDIEVGDLVLAIGNPFGVGQTVTSGIISALARSQEGISDFRTFIQTDAAINPGNSGGPLVTTDGRVVGINTAIFSKSGGSVGIGFAIPSSLALPILESVEHEGRIIRPWLGLITEAISFDIAESLGLSHPYGVVVKQVYPNSPADKAGIRVGDFIAAFDNQQIADDGALDYLVAISPIGKKAEISLLRQGKEVKTQVILSEPQGSEGDKPILIEGRNPLKGTHVLPLSPALALELGLNPMKQGVLITNVSKSAAAYRLGFRSGDIIESINKNEIISLKDIENLLQTKKQLWHFKLRRKDKILNIQVSG